jgi:phosphatidylglycerol:prolipoprotein diacylglycerol transferase
LVGRLSEKNGYLSIIFLMSYSFFRIIAEIFREPDQHLGYLYFGLSMGTLLSLLTIFFGSFFIIWKSKNDFRKN